MLAPELITMSDGQVLPISEALEIVKGRIIKVAERNNVGGGHTPLEIFGATETALVAFLANQCISSGELALDYAQTYGIARKEADHV